MNLKSYFFFFKLILYILEIIIKNSKKINGIRKKKDEQ